MNIRIRSIVISALLSCLPLGMAVAQAAAAPRLAIDAVAIQPVDSASLIEVSSTLTNRVVTIPEVTVIGSVKRPVAKPATHTASVRLTALEQGGSNSGSGVLRFEY